MRFLPLITTAAIAGSLFNIANASEVDPKIHKLCIEAKDYAGCVRAMRGETMPTSRVINSQGADIAEGNQCPSGYAYVGGGNCQEVKCIYSPSGFGYDQGHDQRVAGKANWRCKYSFCLAGSWRYAASRQRKSITKFRLSSWRATNWI